MSATRFGANKTGALFMVAAMAAFALEDSLFKAATQTIPISTALLCFGSLGFALFAARSALLGEPVFHPACFKPTMLVRSAFELMGRLFFALALAYAPLASTSAILQSAPIFVTLGAIFVFGEAVGWRRWLAMGVGFAGVLLIIRPGFESFAITSLYALLATIGFAGRDLATRASPPAMSTAQLGSLGFAVLLMAGLVVSLFETAPTRLPDPASLALTAGAACVGVLAYAALTRAMRVGDIGFVAPYRYTRLLFALVIAFTVFGERPDGLTLLGALVIVLSGAYSFARARSTGG
ncbi:DMT family transporter [uncultured Lentibacter sp.]|jgi:drug/metabolite transporter (DMT)-like permease|uniref:DMT family transporter n=1 Tax=uncultured Lentibacter sp. TaxID=1659309 RepID=UPI002626EEF8|nr:DMT family transporter [uncultured Lentibacter sp.]